MQLEPRMGGIDLQIKSRGLDRFLLLRGQPGETVGEGVGDEEVHGVVLTHSGLVSHSFGIPMALKGIAG